MTKAAEIQKRRVEADLATHVERVEWLTASNPRWSDGTPVDAHTRQALLLQSRSAINAAA
jgi:hypothetical protein